EEETEAGGVVTTSGPAGGGRIELSSKGNLLQGGDVQPGLGGSLLLDPKNLVVDAGGGGYPQFNLVRPGGNAGDQFGAGVAALSTGNVVVTAPKDDFGGNDAGAVYLFNGLTGALISSFTGGPTSDGIGSGGVVTLTNGNYVVPSPLWNG